MSSLIQRVAQMHLASMSKEACIIATGVFGGNRCLFKNRDRNYVPELRVYHAIRNGIEVLYIKDEVTGWIEGINEKGIGIVNAALMVGHDEAEKKLVKTVGRKSADGARILAALEQPNMDAAIEQAKTFKGGLKGHTFISNGRRTVSLEMTSKHDPILKKLDMEEQIHVRTNHGVEHPDAGYTEGEDYISSVSRREQAKDKLKAVTKPEDIAPAIYEYRDGHAEHPNNMVRDNPKTKMRTTSQLVLDLTEKKAMLYLIPGKVRYLGYQVDFPDGYKPKIQFVLFKYTDIDGDGDFDVIEKTDRKKTESKVASRWLEAKAKYQDKKEVPKADGKGTTTVYVYGPRQVSNRNKAKAERVEKLSGLIHRLRAKLKTDMGSKDPKTRLTALAISLIDATYERVGNEGSADDGHYGVTGWLKKHVKFTKGKATLSYVGKSGVKHDKTVSDARLVKALRGCCEDKSPDDAILSFGEDDTDGTVKITSKDVNEYLKPFDVTAKDLRGFHANREMQERLRAIRKDGPELPFARKEKDAILKKEFKQALEETAEIVGHEASTLRNQYLVPGLEDNYIHDGTVMENLKEASVSRVASRYLQSTKTDAEREQDELDRRHRPAPKQKPPRYDSRRDTIREEDPDLDDDDPDLSMNYKDIGG